MVIGGLANVGYQYDNFNRVIAQTAGLSNDVAVSSAVTYYDGNDRIHTMTVGGTTYTFSYDDNGNIISVVGGGKSVYYTYDSQNQLIREDNLERRKSWTWEYDGSGNILYKREYNCTIDALGPPAIPSLMVIPRTSITNGMTD